jgi:hypothetical protein
MKASRNRALRFRTLVVLVKAVLQKPAALRRDFQRERHIVDAQLRVAFWAKLGGKTHKSAPGTLPPSAQRRLKQRLPVIRTDDDACELMEPPPVRNPNIFPVLLHARPAISKKEGFSDPEGASDSACHDTRRRVDHRVDNLSDS